MTTARIRQKKQSRFHQLMTENLSGELFSDWARVVSTTSDSLCFLFQAYCQGLYLRLPKETELASPSFLKGMVLLSEEGNNRSRWRYSATCGQLVLDLPAPLRSRRHPGGERLRRRRARRCAQSWSGTSLAGRTRTYRPVANGLTGISRGVSISAAATSRMLAQQERPSE